MINYGKIIVNNIKKYDTIIKHKQKVIGNERIKVMNDIKEIIDNNKYNVDGILNAINLSIKKFEIGARWFDDIVDNNLDREVNK